MLKLEDLAALISSMGGIDDVVRSTKVKAI